MPNINDILAASSLPTGTNNIGDVDVLTVPAPLSTSGGGTEAAALRVTIANDSTGVVSIDDNGGSLTVDGTVTANLAAGTNNIGDVDVLTLPPIPAGTNNIGGITGTGIMVGASVDVNAAVAADVDAAVAAAAGLRLVGFAARESAATAAAATFIIVHGATGAGGTAVVPVELAGDQSTREWFGPDGIACPNGISIDWVAGTADIHLFFKVVV